MGPGIAAIGGAVDLVVSVGAAAATAAISGVFVHACDVQVAIGIIAGDLHVADKAGGHLSPVGPSQTVVSTVTDEDGASPNGEVVFGHVHPPKERGRWVVISPAGLSVVTASAVNAVMGPTKGIPGSVGLITAHAATAAGNVDPDGEPSTGWLVVQNNRVALGIGEG